MDVEFLKVSEFLIFIEARDSRNWRLDETQDELNGKIQDYIYIYMLYSYSKVLDCEYSHMRSFLKQMLDTSTSNIKTMQILQKRKKKYLKMLLKMIK